MKQVVKEIVPATMVLVRETDTLKIYAARYSLGKDGFLVSLLSPGDKTPGSLCWHFQTFTLDETNRLNYESHYDRIRGALQKGWEVFEFDSLKEALLWMAEQL